MTQKRKWMVYLMGWVLVGCGRGAPLEEKIWDKKEADAGCALSVDAVSGDQWLNFSNAVATVSLSIPWCNSALENEQ